MTRIDAKFESLRARGKKAFVSYIMAGDPNPEASLEIMRGLPDAGVDIIELGLPFTDPMADGATIQLAGQRALETGMTLQKTLDMARTFREGDDTTPIVLMGYYNPIYIYGNDRFIADSVAAGVDGLIIVDLPPEEDSELCIPARHAGLNVVRLITPTSNDQRLPAILAQASGFVYYVSVTGITGMASAAATSIADAYQRIRKQTDLPIVTGFGIRTPEQAAESARFSDGAVVATLLPSGLGR